MVRATFQGIYTSLSGIVASQSNLDVTAQNLTNILTTGYTRQRADLLAIGDSGRYSHIANPQGLYIGQGVNVYNTSQLRNPGYDLRYRTENTKYGYYETKLSGFDDLERIIDDITRSSTALDSGSTSALQDQLLSFLSSLQDITSMASDQDYTVIARNEAQKLAQLLNEQARELQTTYEQQTEDFKTSVDKVNGLLQSIAELDNMIKKESLYGNPSHELKDMRNMLLDTLSGYLPIEYEPKFYGDEAMKLLRDTLPGHSDPYPLASDQVEYSVTLTLPDGMGGTTSIPLVQNGHYAELEWNVYDSPTNPAVNGDPIQRLTVSYPTPSNMWVPGSDPHVPMDGREYSLIEDGMLPPGATSLPTDTALAETLGLGGGSLGAYLDLLTGDGAFGTSTDDNHGVRYYQKMLDVLAETFADNMNSINQVTVGDPFLFVDDTNTNLNITAGNIRISQEWLSDPNALIKTSVSGPLGEENDNILRMINLFDRKNITFGGTDVSGATITTYTGGLVSFHDNLGITLGIDKSTASDLAATYKMNVSSLDNYRQSVSGVDENEEVANMLMFQKAYSASARILTAMDQMLDVLLGMGIVGR
jgi:flagellar hook-associated protein 1 FlgK